MHMLETLSLNAKLPSKEYETAMERLDLRLAEEQRHLRAAGIPVVIVFEGWDAAGKGSTIGRLVQALDPRGFKVHQVEPATEQEHLYPPMHRFWKLLPEQGKIVIMNHSWYRQVINEPGEGLVPAERLAAAYERIRVFERQLTDDGIVLVKYFLHITKKEQAKRFKALEADPAFSWKVGEAERERHRLYARYLGLAEDMLRETSMPYAPWTPVAATHICARNVQTAETLLAAIDSAREHTVPAIRQPAPPPPRRNSILDSTSLDASVSKEEFRQQLPKLQEELRRLQHLCYRHRKPVTIVFEGWDAAGKGGAIRRLTWLLDPRGYEVIPISAPEGDEKRHHHLWRFWRALRKAGHFTIFDRSWYGRVLVERVEGFAQPWEWMRAYREINEFEMELHDHGAVLCKFWIEISKDEQLSRFQARTATPEKQWKMSEEDWRNREKWDAYRQAVSDMLEKTSTPQAPWSIVEGNDKRFARLKVLRVVIERVRIALKG